MAAADILYTDPTLQLAAHRNLFIMAWSDAPNARQMREIERLGLAHGKQHPEGAAALDLILSGTPKFSEEVRKEAVRLNRHPDLFKLAFCDAVLLSGLTGAAVRAFLSTVTLMSKPLKPTKIVGDLRDAAAFLAPLLAVGGQRWTPGDVVALAEPIAKARVLR
jgi:hypothetical protein